MTEYQLQMQLNEMQETLSTLYALQMTALNNSVEKTLTEFYYEEVVNEKGELHHLYNDEKVNKLFQALSIKKELETPDKLLDSNSNYTHNTDDY